MEVAGELGRELDNELTDPFLSTGVLFGEEYDVEDPGRAGVLIVRTRSLLLRLRLDDERDSLGLGLFHARSRSLMRSFFVSPTRSLSAECQRGVSEGYECGLLTF